MSTKIYSGFVFKSADIFAIHNIIQQFRHKIDAYISEEYKQYAANLASCYVDKIACGMVCNDKNDENEKQMYPVYYAFKVLSDAAREAQKSIYKGDIFDYSCSVTVHPYNGRFYGMLFCDKKEIDKMWFDQEIEEYRYWDNTDCPENVTQEEWESRGETWDAILKDFHYVPSMNGFTAEITREMYYYIPLSPDDILSFIPSFEDRVNKIVYEYLCDKFNRLGRSGYRSGFEKWIKKGNLGFKAMNRVKKIFANKIPKEITKEMLIGKNHEENDN